MLRGYVKSNLQYTLINSKTRNGTFGLKGWVSSHSFTLLLLELVKIIAILTILQLALLLLALTPFYLRKVSLKKYSSPCRLLSYKLIYNKLWDLRQSKKVFLLP
jgi:hypothetical protein